MPIEEKTEHLDTGEKIVEIELERLRSFTNHPFKVQADSQMIELQDSIKKYGILNPLIVRPRPEGVYEIISGHRRKYAAERLGYRKVPVIIRAMKDDEAVVSMVDSNLQRERISPSEKAFAYKMKYDAIKRKTGRRKCGQVDHHSGKKTLEVIGEEGGDSPKQVQRYIKITELIPELLEKVDDGSMGFTPAVQISYLKKKEQEEMLEAMDFAQCTPSLSQAIRIKKLSTEGKLTVETMEDRLTESGVELRLREMGKKLGVEKVHPHKFRRTMATRAIEKGMPIEQVQKILGHEQIDTTLRYAMVNQNNVKLSHGQMKNLLLVDPVKMVSMTILRNENLKKYLGET